ncbi:hypothetical protein THEYE_A2017 [Thermodesulfovibrio yellowstonii DSM 11347]|uniref:Uncharacterized protein n=1 Tax=Thermodesulfovibrio yellowstonii (strain ATCC 51303 / DSM 11347 / YP87) TaxID=289376 RepID=B5YIT0_THEYD|nr:hypothetical protein THEYE_A2017 [Thermodesulfovibrio yellowstonii DSM 11347]
MVQMKRGLWITDMTDSILYIPHGSDETGTKSSGGVVKKNFISHMVQMKHN